MGGPDFFQSDVSIPVSKANNFLGFTTSIDGKPVPMEIEQKATTEGIDRTAWLRANGIPLAPQTDAAQAALGKLSAPKHAEAEKMGLFGSDGGPGWTLQTTYHWVQRFPAGVPVVVEHRYTPSVGSTVQTMLGEDKDPETTKRYCVEPSLLASLRRIHDGGKVVFRKTGSITFWSPGATGKSPSASSA
jgi:hypothetical protein